VRQVQAEALQVARPARQALAEAVQLAQLLVAQAPVRGAPACEEVALGPLMPLRPAARLRPLPRARRPTLPVAQGLLRPEGPKPPLRSPSQLPRRLLPRRRGPGRRPQVHPRRPLPPGRVALPSQADSRGLLPAYPRAHRAQGRPAPLPWEATRPHPRSSRLATRARHPPLLVRLLDRGTVQVRSLQRAQVCPQSMSQGSREPMRGPPCGALPASWASI
jgi:hypothetical protein